MRYHTTDMGDRANDVAEMEANRNCGPYYENWFGIFAETYKKTLAEFQEPIGGTTWGIDIKKCGE